MTSATSTLADRLDATALAGFVRFDAPQRAMSETLRAAVVWDRLATLVHARRQLAESCGGVAAQSGFLDAYEVLRGTPPAIQQQIAAEPAFGLWCSTLCELLARQAHLRLPEFHLASHLAEFGRFALAASHVAGLNAVVSIRLDAEGKVTLPCLGLVARFTREMACTRLTGASSGGEVSFSAESSAPYKVHLRRLPRTVTGLVLDDSDLGFRVHGGPFEFATISEAQVPNWLGEMNGALELVAALDAGAANELACSLRVIVPLEARDPSVHESSSRPDAFGAVYLSRADNRYTLAEAFVHEYLHNRLNALLRVDPLVTGPTHEPVYYSPWKAQPRPLRGVLHGVVAFLGVVSFWRSALVRGAVNDVDWVVRRCALLEPQIGAAIDLLERSGQFTRLGDELLSGLRREWERERARAETPADLRLRAEASVAEHRRDFERTHGSRDTSTASAVGRPFARIPDQARDTVAARIGPHVLDGETKRVGWQGAQVWLHDLARLREADGDGFRDLRARLATGGESFRDPATLAFRALVAYADCDPDAAAEDLVKALRTDRNQETYWLALAFCLRKLGACTCADVLLFDLAAVLRRVETLQEEAFSDRFRLAAALELM